MDNVDTSKFQKTEVRKVTNEFPVFPDEYYAGFLMPGDYELDFFEGQASFTSMTWKTLVQNKRNKKVFLKKKHPVVARATKKIENQTIDVFSLKSPDLLKDSALFYFEIPFLVDTGKVEVEFIGDKQMELGKDYFFKFKSKAYHISSKGELSDKGDMVTNYSIYYSMEGNDPQVILSLPEMDELSKSLIFVGDLDHDEIPDIILDTSPKKSTQRIAVYLSSITSEKDEMVKMAGFLWKAKL